MKISKGSLLVTAAFTGLLGGTMARVNASPTGAAPQGSSKSDTAKTEKHACAGKNTCAGKGGCATDGSKNNKAAAAKITEKHACAGKNSCTGKGGCATDGSASKKKT
jgi:hypothetical protein